MHFFLWAEVKLNVSIPFLLKMLLEEPFPKDLLSIT